MAATETAPRDAEASTLAEELRRATYALLGGERHAARNRRRSRGKPLGLLVAGLLAGPAQAAASGDWEISSALLLYSEGDRVLAAEPVLQGTRRFDNDRLLSTKLVLDALTGASANGAVPSTQPQTFTQPSGEGRFTAQPGSIPLDDTFRDTRVALSANWSQPLGSGGWSGRWGLNISNEFDYFSLGLSGLLNYEFNRKNSTLTLGLSGASDRIEPVGGVPTPRAPALYHHGDPAGISSEFADDRERLGRAGNESKTVTDLLLGLTQVLGRRSLVQLNYSLSQTSGYSTDPYKLVSVVDPATGEPRRQLYENRPVSRAKQALYLQWKWAARDQDVLDLSYRYLWDDWALASHTLDVRYRWSWGRRFLTPHLRLYQQSAVDFFQPFLLDGQPVPEDLSADYRLGELRGTTVGLEYGQQLSGSREWRLAVEYYLQSSQEPPAKPGQLADLQIYPDVDALMLRFSFDFGW